jgi:hypothetical protein
MTKRWKITHGQAKLKDKYLPAAEAAQDNSAPPNR